MRIKMEKIDYNGLCELEEILNNILDAHEAKVHRNEPDGDLIDYVWDLVYFAREQYSGKS